MPVPEMGFPTVRPLTLDTDVSTLPEVTIEAPVVVAVAGADMVTVVPLTAEIAVPEGMPGPAISSPATSEGALVAEVMVLVAEVMLPLKVMGILRTAVGATE